MSKIILFLCLFLYLSVTVNAQSAASSLAPGFNAKECDDMMVLNATSDTINSYRSHATLPQYKLLYHSASMGLDNAWNLWVKSDSTLIISLRGTMPTSKSIISDFYCAMFPATGQITLHNQKVFDYNLATESKAAVHGGFLIGFAYLATDIQPKLDSLYKRGYQRYIVTGHSQGGALCFYVSSWLSKLKEDGQYPSLTVKTYASAAPKVGNMFFVNNFDNINKADWAFSVINSADVIPESPLTTQQFEEDMNSPNPFLSLYDKFDKLPLIKRWVLKSAFNKMKKSAIKSSKAYQKYLGEYPEKIIEKMLPGIKLPKAVNTTYFLRPGVNIALQVNERYNEFLKKPNSNLSNHSMPSYQFLLREYYTGLGKLE